MYLYMDESGDAGFDKADRKFLKNGAEPFLVFALVVIEDKKTKQRIERIVRQTVSDLIKHHKSTAKVYVLKKLQSGILKGTVLARYPGVRLRLFQRLAAPELKWHSFVALFDKRDLRPHLPRSESRRYSLLFRNIFLSTYSIPTNQRCIALIVDKKYPWKKDRKLFNQMLRTTFLRKRGLGCKTRLRIFHGEPDQDIPIQLADILANFGRQSLSLNEPLPLQQSTTKRLKDEERRKAELREWQDAFSVLKVKVSWRKPKYFGLGIPRLMDKG